MCMFFQQDVFSVQMDNIKYIGKYIIQLISNSTFKKCESRKFILGKNHALAEPDTSPRQTRLIFSTWTGHCGQWTPFSSLDQNHHITLKSNFKTLVIHLFQGFEVFFLLQLDFQKCLLSIL